MLKLSIGAALFLGINYNIVYENHNYIAGVIRTVSVTYLLLYLLYMTCEMMNLAREGMFIASQQCFLEGNE